MKYEIRKLNLLDLRHIARILKEITKTKSDFANIISNVFKGAQELKASRTDAASKDKIQIKNHSKNPGQRKDDSFNDFISALLPFIDMLTGLFADSESFWEFIASLFSIPYQELEQVPLSDITDMIKALIGNKELKSFFISTSTEETAQKTEESSTTSAEVIAT